MRRSWQINMWRQDDATHSFKNYWAKSFSFLKLELCPARVTGYLEPGLMLKLFDIKPSDPCVCVNQTNICITYSLSSRHRKACKTSLNIKI